MEHDLIPVLGAGSVFDHDPVAEQERPAEVLHGFLQRRTYPVDERLSAEQEYIVVLFYHHHGFDGDGQIQALPLVVYHAELDGRGEAHRSDGGFPASMSADPVEHGFGIGYGGALFVIGRVFVGDAVRNINIL